MVQGGTLFRILCFLTFSVQPRERRVWLLDDVVIWLPVIIRPSKHVCLLCLPVPSTQRKLRMLAKPGAPRCLGKI